VPDVDHPRLRGQLDHPAPAAPEGVSSDQGARSARARSIAWRNVSIGWAPETAYR
jgi:hypothetical protein